MRKLLIFIFFGIIVSSVLNAEELIPFKYNGKYGFVNKSLKIKVLPAFDYVTVNPENGYARLIIDSPVERYLIIDELGNIVIESASSIEYVYDSLFSMESLDFGYRVVDMKNEVTIIDGLNAHAGYSSYPFFPVMKEGEYFYLKTNGEELFSKKTDFWSATSFSCDRAIVIEMSGYYAIINLQGAFIKQGFYELHSHYSENIIGALYKNKKRGYLDLNGNLLFELPFLDETDLNASPFSSGHAIVKVKKSPDEWKVIDNKGNYLSPSISCYNAHEFHDGYSQILTRYNKVTSSYYVNYVNIRGEKISEFDFEEGSDFHNGYAQIVLDGKDGLIDVNGNIIWSKDIVQRNIEKK